MNSQELYDRFRADIVDTATPYLWSDDEVWAYMNDAYRMFVRLTGGIADFTTEEVVRIDLLTGTDLYETHPSILRVMTATLDSDGSEVKVLNATDLPNLFTNNTDYGQVRAMAMKNTPGKVRYFVVGMQRNLAKVIQIPEVDDAILLYVYRLPLTHITDGTHLMNEIEVDHHLHLLKWMKHLAYSKQDAETFDKTKAADAELAFRNYCLQAKTEWERYKTKIRTVSYGGI